MNASGSQAEFETIRVTFPHPLTRTRPNFFELVCHGDDNEWHVKTEIAYTDGTGRIVQYGLEEFYWQHSDINRPRDSQSAAYWQTVYKAKREAIRLFLGYLTVAMPNLGFEVLYRTRYAIDPSVPDDSYAEGGLDLSEDFIYVLRDKSARIHVTRNTYSPSSGYFTDLYTLSEYKSLHRDIALRRVAYADEGHWQAHKRVIGYLEVNNSYDENS